MITASSSSSSSSHRFANIWRGAQAHNILLSIKRFSKHLLEQIHLIQLLLLLLLSLYLSVRWCKRSPWGILDVRGNTFLFKLFTMRWSMRYEYGTDDFYCSCRKHTHWNCFQHGAKTCAWLAHSRQLENASDRRQRSCGYAKRNKKSFPSLLRNLQLLMKTNMKYISVLPSINLLIPSAKKKANANKKVPPK